METGVIVLHDLPAVRNQLVRWSKTAWLDRSYHYSHVTCNPGGGVEDELGYYIHLSRLVDEPPAEWIRHLTGRRLWFDPEMARALHEADRLFIKRRTAPIVGPEPLPDLGRISHTLPPSRGEQ